MKKTEQKEEIKGEALSEICEEPKESFEERIVCHNIKKETAGRSLEQLKDDINKEIGTESDPLVQWDRLIRVIEEALANKKSNPVVISEDISSGNKDTQTGGREGIIDSQQLLMNREKGQGLTLEEKRYMYNEIYKSGKEEKIIKSKYSISDATLRRIKYIFQSAKSILKGPRDTLGIKIFLSRIVKRESWSFIRKQESQFTSKDVWQHMEKTLDVKVSSKAMAKFMNSQLSLFIKKVTLRNPESQHQTTTPAQNILSVRVSKLLEKWEWIMNIDEATVGRLTKENYSWIIKASPGFIKKYFIFKIAKY